MSLSLLTVGGLLALVLYRVLPVVKTPVSECTRNPGPFPLVAEVAGCSQAPCIVRHGQEAVIDITFKAPRNIENMTTVATAYLNTILGVALPVSCDLGEKAATCSHLTGTACPVQAGTSIMYTLRIDVPNTIPTSISLTMEFSIEDDLNLSVVCFSVPIHIEPVDDYNLTANNISTL